MNKYKSCKTAKTDSRLKEFRAVDSKQQVCTLGAQQLYEQQRYHGIEMHDIKVYMARSNSFRSG